MKGWWGRKIGTERHTETWQMDLQLTGSVSKCLQQLGWARLKPGAGCPIWVSPVGDRDLKNEGISCCLSGHALAGSWVRADMDRGPRHLDVGTPVVD